MQLPDCSTWGGSATSQPSCLLNVLTCLWAAAAAAAAAMLLFVYVRVTPGSNSLAPLPLGRWYVPEGPTQQTLNAIQTEEMAMQQLQRMYGSKVKVRRAAS